MSKRQLIAVAVKPDGSLAGHAGRARRWIVYDVWPGEEPKEAYTVILAEDACLHEWHVATYPERHPLHNVDVAIAQSGGEGVVRNLSQRETRLVMTSETDPLAAVKAYLAEVLPPGLPHDEAACGDHAHTH